MTDHDVPDPQSLALARALTRVREETWAKSAAESELGRVRRELGAAENTITGLRDELEGARSAFEDADAYARVNAMNAADFFEMSARVAELQAVIAAVREANEYKGGECHYRIYHAISDAPSDVLAAHDAQVWDEGYEAGADFHEAYYRKAHWEESASVRTWVSDPAPVNPYRSEVRALGTPTGVDAPSETSEQLEFTGDVPSEVEGN